MVSFSVMILEGIDQPDGFGDVATPQLCPGQPAVSAHFAQVALSDDKKAHHSGGPFSFIALKIYPANAGIASSSSFVLVK